MVVSTARRKLTYDDFVQIPEDGRRHEILDGVHVVTAAPYTPHQDVVLEVSWWIHSLLRGRERGKLYIAPTDVLLGKHDIVEPDLLYLSQAKLDLIGARNIQGAPDLAIEVLSPSTRRIDLGKKRSRYEALGVGEYWVLDPERREARVFRRERPDDRTFQPPIHLSAEAGDRLSTPLLRGLEIPLREVFAG